MTCIPTQDLRMVHSGSYRNSMPTIWVKTYMCSFLHIFLGVSPSLTLNQGMYWSRCNFFRQEFLLRRYITSICWYWHYNGITLVIFSQNQQKLIGGLGGPSWWLLEDHSRQNHSTKNASRQMDFPESSYEVQNGVSDNSSVCSVHGASLTTQKSAQQGWVMVNKSWSRVHQGRKGPTKSSGCFRGNHLLIFTQIS